MLVIWILICTCQFPQPLPGYKIKTHRINEVHMYIHFFLFLNSTHVISDTSTYLLISIGSGGIQNNNKNLYFTYVHSPHKISQIQEACIACIFTFSSWAPSLCYKRKHLSSQCAYEQLQKNLKLITKCSIQYHNMCSYLPHASSPSFSCFLHLAEVLQYHIIKASILGLSYTHIN